MCSCDQSLVTAAFLWEKLSQPQFYKDLTRKTAFFEGWSWFKFNNLGLTLVTNLKFYISVAKGWKLNAKKFWGLIPMFVEVTGGKLVELSWIGLMENFIFCAVWIWNLILFLVPEPSQPRSMNDPWLYPWVFLKFLVLGFGLVLGSNTLKFQCLLMDLRVLISPYSKFC